MSQRKITQGVDASELPELTGQQREFVRHILAGKTASDAYRAAYDASNMLPNSVWCEASKLRSNASVAQWLSAARQAHLGTAVITKDQHLQELERLREIALASGNVGAAVLAETTRGKVAGHHIERIEDVTQRTDPIATLKEIAIINPDLAAALAQQEGIPWTVDDGATRH